MPSSQRSARGRRKPDGGGPEGVAARRVDVEKAAAVVAVEGDSDVRTVERKELWGRGRRRALESMARGLAAAMLVGCRRMAKTDMNCDKMEC